MGSSSLYRNGRSQLRADAALKQAAVREARDTWMQHVEEMKAAEESRVRLTRDQITGATHVRTRFGWHKVARVNKTTVSVETGYSWTDRYPFDEIHEARTL